MTAQTAPAQTPPVQSPAALIRRRGLSPGDPILAWSVRGSVPYGRPVA